MVFPRPTSSARMHPPLAKTAEREDHGIDLMRVRIDASLTLRGSIALAVVRSPDADHVLCHHAQIEAM